MPLMSVLLNEREYEALIELASVETRDPRSQLLHIVREKLIQRGLLPTIPPGESPQIIQPSTRAEIVK